MAQKTNGNVALCPECEGPVQLRGKLQVGQKLSCRRCGSALVIVDRKPLDLILANGKYEDIDNPRENRKKNNDDTQSLQRQINKRKENPQMSTLSKVLLADCPECSATLRFHRSLKERQLVVCPECDETLEVVSLHPLQFHWANEDPGEFAESDGPQYRSRYGSR